ADGAGTRGYVWVLYGQIDLGPHAGGAGEGVDESGADCRGLQVADTDPFDPGDCGEPGQELLQCPHITQVLAVGGGVFADQEEFADALSSEPFGFAEDVLRLAGEVGAPEGGDGAERAAAVAPRGDVEVGDGTAGEP